MTVADEYEVRVTNVWGPDGLVPAVVRTRKPSPPPPPLPPVLPSRCEKGCPEGECYHGEPFWGDFNDPYQEW